MKGRCGNPGLRGRLVDKSVEGYILALETINRLSIRYRVETFCYLICNAWELLLKAKILEDTNNDHNAIYRGKKKRGERRDALSLRDCLERCVPSRTDPERRNIEYIAELRDESVHLVLSRVPSDVMGMFQACVINYHRRLNDWFGITLSDRVHVGMMSIVYDMDPQQGDVTSKLLRRELGREAADYLARYSAKVKAEFDQLQQPVQFSVGINYHLALTKKADDADIVLSQGPAGATVARVVEVAKDPSKSHPYRQKEVLAKVKEAAPGLAINQHDIQCVNHVHGIRQRADFYYRGTVKGSPTQYSPAFVDWLVQQYGNDQQFFAKAKAKTKAEQGI